MGRVDQTIDFACLAERRLDRGAFDAGARASSGLAVAMQAAGACRMRDDGEVEPTALGTCTLTASQGGNESFRAATSVSRSFDVRRHALWWWSLWDWAWKGCNAH